MDVNFWQRLLGKSNSRRADGGGLMTLNRARGFERENWARALFNNTTSLLRRDS